MRRLTFIHTADLHLDSPMVGLRDLPENIFTILRESTFNSFSRIVDIAIERQVDFFLIVGDLFDSDDRSVRAQIRFKREMERLYEKNITVFITHGNHDHLDAKWTMIEMPTNVHIFPTTVEVKRFISTDGTTANLYGFSYEKRHIYNNMTSLYKKCGEADFHLGLLHGHAEGESEHSRYAPFKLAELIQKHFDYWALGHIHKATILHKEPYIVYPGNIQGRHKAERGRKGCYIVSLVENETTLEWLDTATVIWEEITINAENINNFDSLYELCINTLNEYRKMENNMIVSIKIKQINNEQLVQEIEKHDLISLLQENEQSEQIFIYPSSISIEENNIITRDNFIHKANFYKQLFQTIDDFSEWDETLSYLYDHHQARKYINKLSDKEKNELLIEAEQLLLKLLYEN